MNLIIPLVCQVVGLLYGFVLPRLILVQFGSEINGLLQSIAQFLGVISFLDMGIGQVVRSALYKPLSENDQNQISCILASGARFYRKIAYALLAYVVILLVTYPWLVEQSFDWLFTASMILIMSLGSFAQYYFGIIQEQLLYASQKIYLIYFIQIIFYLLNMVVSFCMIFAECSIHAIKFATACVFLIKPLFYSWYVHRNYDINWGINFQGEPIKQKWNGVSQHISAVVLEGTDNIVLTVCSTLANVSVYSVYFMIITNVHGLYQSIVMGIQSAAGNLWAKQNMSDIKGLFSSAEIGLHMATVFLYCCTGKLIVPFVSVYTKGLTDVNYIQPLFAAIFVFAYGIKCLRTPYNIWILAAGHFKQTQRCHIIAAILNLVLSIVFVSEWGLVGVSIGTLIAMCYQTIWMALYTVRNLIKCPIQQFVKQITADVFAVIIIMFSTSLITLKSFSYLGWISMAIKVALVALLCVIGTLLLFYRRECIRLLDILNVKLN